MNKERRRHATMNNKRPASGDVHSYRNKAIPYRYRNSVLEALLVTGWGL